MANFGSKNEMTARFERGEVRTLNLGATSYTNNVQIATLNGDSVELRFANREDLKEFLEAMVTLALKWAPEESYMTAYVNLGDADTPTIEDMKERTAPEEE